MQDRNEAYAELNLSNATLDNLDIDIMVFADVKGQLVTGRFRDPASGEIGILNAGMLDELGLPDQFEFANAVTRRLGGIARTSRGPMFVVAGPILRSDKTGPSAGALILGHYLDADWIAKASAQLQTGFALHGIGDALPGSAGQVGRIDYKATVATEYVPYASLSGRTEFFLAIDTPRTISARGRQIQKFIALSILAATATFIAAISLLLGALVVKPLGRLSAHIANIRKTGELTEFAGSNRRDEIGLLANQFNSLMAEHRASRAAVQRQATAIEQSSEAIIITGAQGQIEYVNPAYVANTGFTTEEVLGKSITARRQDGTDDLEIMQDMRNTLNSGNTWSGAFYNRKKDGSIYEEQATVSPIRDRDGSIVNFVAVRRDVTAQRQLERELGQSQKLQSIGQLAAGIAHEINTPTQYVGDNTQFLKESFANLEKLLAWLSETAAQEGRAVATDRLREALHTADTEFLLEEIPRALQQSQEGIGRIAEIVRSMKEFSHPARDKSPADLNRALQGTVTVATSEWKYIASLKTDLDDELPLVPCLLGDFNQVILNIIVNAAHAIADRSKDGPSADGEISISSHRDGDWVEIRIADNGCGMPPDVKARIFDPFFTTKATSGSRCWSPASASASCCGSAWGSTPTSTRRSTTSCPPRSSKPQASILRWAASAASRTARCTASWVPWPSPGWQSRSARRPSPVRNATAQSGCCWATPPAAAGCSARRSPP
jgi:PAS domain S-box-containing protein